MIFPELETDRLTMRQMTRQDSAELFTLFSDPEITRYMDIDPLTEETEAMEIIEFHFDDSGCRWGLFDRQTGKLIGTCGYNRWRPGICTAEIGYDLSPAYWGQGVMQEALAVILDFGLNKMGLTIIEAEVERDNGRSIGLLKKMGFQLDLGRTDGKLDWFLLFEKDWN